MRVEGPRRQEGRSGRPRKFRQTGQSATRRPKMTRSVVASKSRTARARSCRAPGPSHAPSAAPRPRSRATRFKVVV